LNDFYTVRQVVAANYITTGQTMLKTISRFTSSFAALLKNENTIIDADGRLETIRCAMLDALMELDLDQSLNSESVWAAIVRASEVQTLWFLRSDLLRLLADAGGEAAALVKIEAITKLFRGVVPNNQMQGRKRIGR
jgi:hypothetical protein